MSSHFVRLTLNRNSGRPVLINVAAIASIESIETDHTGIGFTDGETALFVRESLEQIAAMLVVSSPPATCPRHPAIVVDDGICAGCEAANDAAQDALETLEARP